MTDTAPSETPLTTFQKRLIRELGRRPNQIASSVEIARALKTSFVAVVSSANALERRGYVAGFRHGNDEWASLMWRLLK